jgi:hypothetical protein
MTDRRSFLSDIAMAGLAVGALPWLEEAVEAAPPTQLLFAPNPQDSDMSVFAAARRQLSFEPSIAFCDTGTWGALPREVIDAVINGFTTVEQGLPE